MKNRVIICSRCFNLCSYGTTRVRGKIIFQFCSNCWTRFREECDTFMQKAA